MLAVLQFSCDFDEVMGRGEHSIYLLFCLDWNALQCFLNFFFKFRF